jgi:hypothetical protein
VDLELRAFGVEDAARRIDLLGDRTRAPTVLTLWSGLLEDLLGAERKLFRTERGWKDIKTVTIQRKGRDKDPRVRANNYKTLRGTGRLEDFLTHRGQGRQPLDFGANGFLLGIPRGQSPVFYGAIQKKRGRNPIVSKGIAKRIAGPRVRDFLMGGDE